MKKTYMTPSMAITKIATQHLLTGSLLNTNEASPTQDDFTQTTDDTGNNLSRRYDVWEEKEE
ncbi:hypothetical protein L6472_11975 [Prevotella sp. E13-17]|uniref:hypothetical protein n=1 Tax=Prevotella sp. E13-17 TaxID=2913616 RepID=UPI001EDC80A2|nr:hypothetical protein [Prevotella sp. E13-17]UKK50712.1 hypothetical protein L6472_11975 [Prevotella sp. E13-17]